jgi:threonine-phosphate decarboxylase
MDLHGGNVHKIFREKNLNEVLDYSSNINPFGVPESFKKSLIDNFDLITRYPDPDYFQLKNKFANFNNVKPKNILVGNGATELIFLYMKNLNPKRTLIVSPTFAEYERAVRAIGGKIDYFQLLEEDEFKIDLIRLEEKLKVKYDLLIICNPNNPTGKRINRDKLSSILESCNKYGTHLFLDEAFIEFTEGGHENSLIKEGVDKKNLFVLRALTKFFAIPGLRLGYGICYDGDLSEKIEKDREPWTVNGFAELAGLVMLDDYDYIKKSKDWIKQEKAYMYSSLKKLPGVKTYKTEANFILVKLLKGDSKLIRNLFLESGILVRDAANFKYLDSSFIRLAIKDRNNNSRIIETFSNILEKLY